MQLKKIAVQGVTKNITQAFAIKRTMNKQNAPNKTEMHHLNQKKNMRNRTFQNKTKFKVKLVLKSIPPARLDQRLLFVPLCLTTTTTGNKQF